MRLFPSSNSTISEELAEDDPTEVVVAIHKLPLVGHIGPSMNWIFTLKEENFICQLIEIMSKTHKVYVIGLLDIKFSTNMQDVITNKLINQYNFFPIFLPQDGDGDDCTDEHFLRNYLWPLLNGVPSCLSHHRFNNEWNRYISRNLRYAVKVNHLLNSGKAIVWIEDYTLMLLPNLIRRKHPKTQIVFLLRNPFPSLEMFQIMTTMKELLIGMLGSDLITFSSSSHSYHFLSSCEEFFDLKYKSSSGLMELEFEGRLIAMKVVPVMIHMASLTRFLNEPTNEEWFNKVESNIGGRQVVLAIDNLSECCGIELKFHAIEEILNQGVFVILVQLIVRPQHATKDAHARIQKIQALRDLINVKHGIWGLNYEPIIVRIYEEEVDQKERTRYYKLADCLVITAIRDIVYYTPFEFILCGKSGNMVISNTVRSPLSLSSVIKTNPWDIKEVREAILFSLARPKNKEGHVRDLAVVDRQKMETIFSDILVEVKHQCRSYEWKDICYVGFGQGLRWRPTFHHDYHFGRLDVEELQSTYDSVTKRLIIIDCDEKLNPMNEKLLDSKFSVVLNALCSDFKNTVVLFSSLSDGELPNWFNSCVCAKRVMEDGFLIKDVGLNEDIKLREDEILNWKKSVGDILEIFERKTAGTFLREKYSSFVWHFDCLEPHLADLVVEEIQSLWRDGIIDGSTVMQRDKNYLSIKHQSVTKGAAAEKLLMGKRNDEDECPPDFVLFVGLDGVDGQLVDALQRVVSFSDKEVKICKIRVGFLPLADGEYVSDAEELVKVLGGLANIDVGL